MLSMYDMIVARSSEGSTPKQSSKAHVNAWAICADGLKPMGMTRSRVTDAPRLTPKYLRTFGSRQNWSKKLARSQVQPKLPANFCNLSNLAARDVK
jgi:hypothetical protein